MNIGANILLIAICLLIYGCNSDSSEDSTFEEMVSMYDTYTVDGIWEALDEGDDVNGTYILLAGEVDDIDEDDDGYVVVRLIDGSTGKTVECLFDSGTDTSCLAEDDAVTIGGICRFCTDDPSYPYLDDCDYVYVNG